MDWILPVSGLILAGVAVLLSLLTAGDVKVAGEGKEQMGEARLQASLSRIWLASACAAGAGAIQSLEGDVLIVAVWGLFLMVQGFNINTIHSAIQRERSGRGADTQ